MKKSFALLITILLLTIFAYLSTFILETKSLSRNNLTNAYLHTQASFHMDFMKKYINSLDLKNECFESLKIEEVMFSIEAFFHYDDICISSNPNKLTTDIYVKSKIKKYQVSLHQQIKKDL